MPEGAGHNSIDVDDGAVRSPIVAFRNLEPPRLRSETVHRTALVDQICTSRALVTVVSGPAGAGKSTLLAQCHAAIPDAAWLTMDRADNDPVVLWWSLIESIRHVAPDFGDDYRSRLTIAGQTVVDEIVVSVANELAARRQSLHLFLDDVDTIGEHACRESLATFIRQLPDDVRVTMASRGLPPVPLARLRVEGALLEIGAAELTMSSEEAGEVLHRHLPLVEPELVERIVSHTEGWVAGLHLAGMALSATEDATAFVAGASDPDTFVADYFWAEVLASLTPTERRFLADTSILTRLSGDLCNAVTGRTDSDEMLHELERKNVFVVPLDRVGVWFRYHRLFAELLSANLLRLRPGDVAGLHRRAYEWLRTDGPIEEAVQHARAAGLVVDAADLVAEHWFELVSTGRLTSARSMIEDFDDATVAQHQPLALAAAFVYGLGGDQPAAQRFLLAAERGTYHGAPPDGAASMESSLAVTRSSLALDGVDQALADARRVKELEPPLSPWAALAELVIGLAMMMKGEVEAAVPYLEHASAAAETTVSAYALAQLALAHLDRGDPLAAASFAARAQEQVGAAALDDLIMAATVRGAAALAYLALDRPDDARRELACAARPMRHVGQAMPIDAMQAALLLAEVAIELGEHDTARTYLNGATRVATTIADTGRMSRRLAKLRKRWKAEAGEPAEQRAAEEPITRRELEVLVLLSAGLTNREIADELFLSRNTVKTYLRHLFRKLDVSTRAAAVGAARQRGLLVTAERV